MDGIPLIDISPLSGSDVAARALVAARIGVACRGTGFFVITGHGVAPALVQDAFAAAHEVFALAGDAKRDLAITRHGHNRGYVGLGVETLDETAVPDLKEAYNLIWPGDATRPPNIWPPLPGWSDRVQSYFDAVLAVGRRLHTAFAADLGLAEDFFADKLDRPMATLRFLRYPAPVPGATSANQPGAGTHTDYGNVTLLATDGVAGLQVRRRDGAWMAVPPTPGAFICNIGDCLMRWSNDVYVSTPHRVVAPTRERYSIALFVDPNPDALVSAMPSCVPAGEAPRYAPITARAYLRQRLSATYAHKDK